MREVCAVTKRSLFTVWQAGRTLLGSPWWVSPGAARGDRASENPTAPITNPKAAQRFQECRNRKPRTAIRLKVARISIRLRISPHPFQNALEKKIMAMKFPWVNPAWLNCRCHGSTTPLQSPYTPAAPKPSVISPPHGRGALWRREEIGGHGIVIALERFAPPDGFSFESPQKPAAGSARLHVRR